VEGEERVKGGGEGDKRGWEEWEGSREGGREGGRKGKREGWSVEWE